MRRICTRRLVGWRDPEVVFRAWFADAAYTVWLDGGSDAATGVSVLATAHAGSEFVTADAGRGTVSRVAPLSDDEPATVAASVFEVLAEGLGARSSGPTDADHDLAARLGWYGWFGYELGAQLNDVPASDAETPDAAFLFVDRAIVFDHAARTMQLVWCQADETDAAAAAWADDLESRFLALDPGRTVLDRPAAVEGDRRQPPTVRWRHSPERYAELIGECQAAIVRGDAYQLCLTNRVDVDVRPDPAATYLALRASSPSHHGGLLRFGEFALLSASPEQFLLVDADGFVTTKPMKGTRPRGNDTAADLALRRELVESEKERAENLMIVDLMRNDLGRIAELGSVSVPSLLEVEEYAHVHQLVSTVRARIRHPLTALDVVAAAFPAGSMTGAPKRSAMTILHELEQGPRGVYSGTFGYLGIDGSADLAMVIRSIVLTPRGASIGTGGGITALSVAEEEIEETRVKARALLAVLGAAAPRGE
ncbi:aminodeoxychorismate synthase component I [Agromyces sp. Marseille-P2726]|uniref:aminodeoxychorismate synthase component I n=1 Tax=Agromyces sp. Marseille-P2726 TaxID=2709132 RepID=UPI0015710A0F|nr:aminodeoxychorismate synthase component I [Agromyces sp. Marseille-P2726]